jgi:hypothetical protein
VWASIAEAVNRFPSQVAAAAVFARSNRSNRLPGQICSGIISLLSTVSGISSISGAIPEMRMEFQKMF